MSKINFYRQGRNDGGIRSGVDIDGEEAFGAYRPGSGDLDPSLQWYVDIEWSGAALPRQPNEVKSFLLAQETTVRDACNVLAERLAVGIDKEPAPFSQPFNPGISGVQAAIFCSTARRISGRDIKETLVFIGSSWARLLTDLRPLGVEAA